MKEESGKQRQSQKNRGIETEMVVDTEKDIVTNPERKKQKGLMKNKYIDRAVSSTWTKD